MIIVKFCKFLGLDSSKLKFEWELAMNVELAQACNSCPSAVSDHYMAKSAKIITPPVKMRTDPMGNQQKPELGSIFLCVVYHFDISQSSILGRKNQSRVPEENGRQRERKKVPRNSSETKSC